MLTYSDSLPISGTEETLCSVSVCLAETVIILLRNVVHYNSQELRLLY